MKGQTPCLNSGQWCRAILLGSLRHLLKLFDRFLSFQPLLLCRHAYFTRYPSRRHTTIDSMPSGSQVHARDPNPRCYNYSWIFSFIWAPVTKSLPWLAWKVILRSILLFITTSSLPQWCKNTIEVLPPPNGLLVVRNLLSYLWCFPSQSVPLLSTTLTLSIHIFLLAFKNSPQPSWGVSATKRANICCLSNIPSLLSHPGAQPPLGTKDTWAGTHIEFLFHFWLFLLKSDSFPLGNDRRRQTPPNCAQPWRFFSSDLSLLF